MSLKKEFTRGLQKHDIKFIFLKCNVDVNLSCEWYLDIICNAYFIYLFIF